MSANRIVLLGATGHTGRLAARALVRRGQRPVLAGRSRSRTCELAAELGGLDTATVDLARHDSLKGLLEPGDVLVSTVGPFALHGDIALDVALAAGAHWLDCTGEPPFVRSVFERHGPRAAAVDCVLLPAFGWESVPGNLAAALALADAGESAARVDVGNFYDSPPRFRTMSPGTRASFAATLPTASFAYRGGAIRNVRPAERCRRMPTASGEQPAISLGTSEHFSLPRLFPGLREVNSYLGWYGSLSRPMQLASPAAPLLRLPGLRALHSALVERLAAGLGGGPGPGERRRVGSETVAIAYDDRGAQLAKVHLRGGDGYEFTGAILAWGAERLAGGPAADAGALGPVEAFGTQGLEAACREAKMTRV